jgi:hypothetical protein
MDKTTKDSQIASLRRQLSDMDAHRASIEAQLAALLEQSGPARTPATPKPTLSPGEKIGLFRRLFAGRQDVFALRWENRKDGRSGYAPACANEWVAGVCAKPKIKCGACPNHALIPVSDDVIDDHLRGSSNSHGQGADYVMGVYPLLHDDRCWFLAADFDGENWAQDARAYLETCRARNVPAALERSRSGQGGHVWIFFAELIAAREARRLGAALITETMERRPEIGFKSYDRFFPNQDVMPTGGFGNLIALPLARRSRDQGNSVFVDDRLEPHEDQWEFLTSLKRMPRADVSALVLEAQESGKILGVRLPYQSMTTSWRSPGSFRPHGAPNHGRSSEHCRFRSTSRSLTESLWIAPTFRRKWWRGSCA